MNKTDKKQTVKNLYWIIPVVVVILVSVGVVWNFHANKTASNVPNDSGSQGTSVSTPSEQTGTEEVKSSENNAPNNTAMDSPNESELQGKSTDDHVTPTKEVVITIPQSPLGDVEDPPDINAGIQLNSIHKGIEEMSKNLEELEKELEKDPTNQGLKEEIERTKEIIEDLKQEMEKLLNGDL